MVADSNRSLAHSALVTRFGLDCSLVVGLVVGLAVGLGNSRNVAAAEIATFRSKNFIVHTDDEPAPTRKLLERLETLLTIVSGYWNRPNRQTIECCVVKDLANWPPGRLPPLALQKIRSGSGVTISVKRSRGKAFVTKSIVYAVARPGATQHEAVHAYCHQMFGSSGPVWYSEGMAEMGRYWANHNDRSVRADRGAIQYLRQITPTPVKTLTQTGQTSDGWKNYAQRWALCHLLANNPNYGQRFRTLGLSLMSGRRGSGYQSFFRTMDREINFEYQVFLKTLETGYRVDLCAWDWKTRFRPAREGRQVTVQVLAGQGWQASRIAVQKGLSYEVRTSGRWKTSAEANQVDADGDSRGVGRLQAVIWNNYQLTATAKLGTHATFQPASDGKLFLRCGDRWGELHDNTGQIQVQVTLLPAPK